MRKAHFDFKQEFQKTEVPFFLRTKSYDPEEPPLKEANLAGDINQFYSFFSLLLRPLVQNPIRTLRQIQRTGKLENKLVPSA